MSIKSPRGEVGVPNAPPCSFVHSTTKPRTSVKVLAICFSRSLHVGGFYSVSVSNSRGRGVSKDGNVIKQCQIQTRLKAFDMHNFLFVTFVSII